MPGNSRRFVATRTEYGQSPLHRTARPWLVPESTGSFVSGTLKPAGCSVPFAAIPTMFAQSFSRQTGKPLRPEAKTARFDYGIPTPVSP